MGAWVTDIERAWHPAGGNPRIAHSLLQGMNELNALYPNRPQGAQEGTIGDTNHLSEGWTASDHNPWVTDSNGCGVVRAWDIQTEGAPFDAQKLADHLAAIMRAQYKFFGSVGYVIYNRRITSWQPWGVWQPYTGSDPHDRHIHVSLGLFQAEYDSALSWDLAAAFSAEPVPTPASGPATPVTDWYSFMDDKTFRALQGQLADNINNHVIAYNCPKLVRFPRAPKAPSAIYAWDGSTLLWLTAQDYKALGNLHFVDVVDHANSNIYKCPVVAGTRDPRK